MKSINNLEKQIIKDWGKKCKVYSPFCIVCNVWRAFEILKLAYNEKSHIGNNKWRN